MHIETPVALLFVLMLAMFTLFAFGVYDYFMGNRNRY